MSIQILMKRTFLLHIILLICITISGCRGKGTDEQGRTGAAHAGSGEITDTSYQPAYGDTLVVGSIGEPSVLIPMLAGDSASHAVAGLVINGLVKYDTDLTIIGDLAESWDISDDGLVITFHLKKGVQWTDGIEFTAHDVMFGYETIIDEKIPTPYKEDYLQVKKAEVLDRYTFRATYEKPFAPALSTWGSLVVLPRHLLEGKDITTSDFGRNPVGMGPYIFKKWTSGQDVILDSNRNYFEGRPYIGRYIYKIIPDPATMFLELKTFGVDLMGLTPIQYTKQTDSDFFQKNFQKFRYPVFSYTYFGFNLRHPWFQDKRVRQAFAHAIDKEEIIDVVLFGLGSPATGPYVPNTWAYNPDVRKYEYDLNRAKTLLREAGWEDTDNDGLLDRDGRPFEFSVLTNMGNRSRIKTATIIQYRLKKIGIKMNIRVLEWSTFINEF
jgi:peptide/nickel transport system substrate-binding protein